jgi:hypothetical protein
MALEIPNLDDRRWVDLVEEARSLIPRLAPLWTDHNAHDPGMTFIELFAWLAEMQIYQLNRVGVAHREGFSKLVGIERRPLKPAQVDVRVEGTVNTRTFIPAGTQLTPLEGEEIVFETLADLLLTQSQLERVIVNDGSGPTDQTKTNDKPGIAFLAFGENAREGAELKLGFNALHPEEEELRLTAHVFTGDLGGSCGFDEPWAQIEDEEDGAASVDIVWEYLAKNRRWLPLEFKDETGAFSHSGAIILSVPANGEADLGHFWIRARIRSGHYDIEPRLSRIAVNVLSCAQRETVRSELIGEGNGRPDQSFELAKGPILIPDAKPHAMITSGDVADWEQLARELEPSAPSLANSLRKSPGASRIAVGSRYRRIRELNKYLTGSGELRHRIDRAIASPRKPHARLGRSDYEDSDTARVADLIGRTPLVIQVDNDLWHSVPSFDRSARTSRHYVFDVDWRCVQFGNGLNGQIPITGQQIRAVWYQASNGRSGNVAKGLQWRFRNFGIAGVTLTNPEPATGGSNLEPLNEMELRARAQLSRSQRAVTLRDFERLALSTPHAYVARAKAIANCPVPERITVVAVPKVRPGRKGIPPAPSDLFLRKVERHLQLSRLLCDNLRVVGPLYVEVQVSAKLRLAKGAGPNEVRERARQALDRFLKGDLQPVDPIAEERQPTDQNNTSSPCPTLWPFGRAVFPSEVYAILDSVQGVDFAYDLALSTGKSDQNIQADKTGAIKVPRIGLVLPGQHNLTADSDGRRKA